MTDTPKSAAADSIYAIMESHDWSSSDIDPIVCVPRSLLLDLLEPLRLAHVWALKDSHPELLSEDFKPWKWDGYELEYVKRCRSLHERIWEQLDPDGSIRSRKEG